MRFEPSWNAWREFLTMLEGRRTLDELTPGRAALWGALAGASLPAMWFLFFSGPLRSVLSTSELIPLLLGAGGAYGALSACLASATVWIARRAPSQISSGIVPGDMDLLGEPEEE